MDNKYGFSSSLNKTLLSLYELHDIFFDETSAFAYAVENAIFRNSKKCPNSQNYDIEQKK